MFDAGEILFLDRAVGLGLLTRNQRERLMGYQDQMPPGMKATTLVVEAGLMVDSEVSEVLNAIASGVGRAPGAAPTWTADTGGMQDVEAATSDSLRDILDAGNGAHDMVTNADNVQAVADAVRGVLHGGRPPAAGPSPSSEELARANREAAMGFSPPQTAGQPRFPIPGFEAPGEMQRMDDRAEQRGVPPWPEQQQSEHGYPQEQQDPSTQPDQPDNPLRRFAASPEEMDQLLSELSE